MHARPRRLAFLLASVLACSAPIAPGAEGTWGGTEASMTLARSGGNLSYACGAGTVDSGWTLSRDGRFTATGQHFFGGGPVPPEGHPPHPARYAGQVEGRFLTLTVTLIDLAQKLGPFRLERDGPVVAELCL